MKSITKFSLIYSICFSVFAIVEEILFDPSVDTRMQYTIAGCVYYFILGTMGWFIISALFYRINNLKYRFAASFLPGLILLNALYYFATDGGHGSNLILLAININCLVAFVIGAISSVKKASNR